MRVQDIMSRDVETIGPDAPAEEAWERMTDSGIHHLVVRGKGRSVEGIISKRDLGGRRGVATRENACVRDLMSPRIVSARPTTTVRQAANLFRGRSIGCLIVIEEGKLRGIITTTDLLELIGRGVERPGPIKTRAAVRGVRGRRSR